jgi:hypothetical protein
MPRQCRVRMSDKHGMIDKTQTNDDCADRGMLTAKLYPNAIDDTAV